jgi:hypothetical protein
MRQKFRQLAALVLTHEGVAVVEDALNQCEDWSHVGHLADLTRLHSLPEILI